MKMSRVCFVTAVLFLEWGLAGAAAGDGLTLPSDFPRVVITDNGGAAPGVFIGSFGTKGTAATSYDAILDNSGRVLFYGTPDTLSECVMLNGLIAVRDDAINGYVLRDESLAVVDSFSVGGDYTVDGHGFELLCNGHALLMGSETRRMDVSQIVSGGRPDAEVGGAVLQELDANKRVIFQWRTLDYIPLTDSFNVLTDRAIDFDHVNWFTLDPLDNNYLVSMRGLCQVLKVSRTTGELIWRLGGKNSDFTFIGEHPENAPYYFIGQHSVHRLVNGNLVFFDDGRGVATLAIRPYTRAVEYHLDEVNMTATLVWEYRHSPDISAPGVGSIQRFTNGNTLIGWFSASRAGTTPILTELSPNGAVVFEMSTPGYKSQSQFMKKVWNSPDLVRSTTHRGVAPGQTYDSPDAGVSVTVSRLGGTPDNAMVVRRHLDAARFPQFPGKAPVVLVERVTLSGSGIDTLEADLSLAIPDNTFCFDTPLFRDPAQLRVYHRVTPSQGVFAALPTTYDAASQRLTVTGARLGEFIFAYPDLPEIPLAPVLRAPESQSTVNQEQPVKLDWAPRGFARSYRLQVATDALFGNRVLDETVTEMGYVLQNVTSGTRYYWRVKVSNDGGTSGWSAASFQTVPPRVEATVPNGGELWKRGLSYFIRWDDNIAEDVVIGLYRDDVPVTTIATVPSTGAYNWEVNLDLEPGSGYSIKITSSGQGTLSDMSDSPFTIQ